MAKATISTRVYFAALVLAALLLTSSVMPVKAGTTGAFGCYQKCVTKFFQGIARCSSRTDYIPCIGQCSLAYFKYIWKCKVVNATTETSMPSLDPSDDQLWKN